MTGAARPLALVPWRSVLVVALIVSLIAAPAALSSVLASGAPESEAVDSVPSNPASQMLAERLRRHEGVWVGEYVYRDADGAIVDRHASRHEAILEGDRWAQAIAYLWEDGRVREQLFEARIVDGELVFEHEELIGQFWVVSDEIAVFEAGWRSKPGLRVVETIVQLRPDRQTRSWLVYEGEALVQRVWIDEVREGQNSSAPAP